MNKEELRQKINEKWMLTDTDECLEVFAYEQGRMSAFQEIAYSDRVHKEHFEKLAYEKGRADAIEEVEKNKNELYDLHNLMFDYFEKVDIFTEKTEMERLALKIVTDGMQIIGATIDKLEQLKEQKPTI